MSFLKAMFFMLPLAAIASIVIAYFFTMQWIQPRYDEVILKFEAAVQSIDVNTEAIKQLQQTVDNSNKGVGQ